MQLNFTRQFPKLIIKECVFKALQFSLFLILPISVISCGSKDEVVKIRLIDANGKVKRAKIKVPIFNKKILEQINAESKERVKSGDFSKAQEVEQLPKIDNINSDNKINKLNKDTAVDFVKSSSENIDNIFMAKKQQPDFGNIESGDLFLPLKNNKNKIRKIQPSSTNNQEIAIEEQEPIDLKHSSFQSLQKDKLSSTYDTENNLKTEYKRKNLDLKAGNNKFNFSNSDKEKKRVQVGVFNNMTNAKKTLLQNKKFGNAKIIVTKNGKNNIYKVIIGPFKNNANAVKIAEKIKNNGGEAVLVK